MTVLTTLQGVAKKIGITVPSAVASSDEREHVELFEMMNEAARDIAEAYDWQVLNELATITGDDSTTAFALESNYDRMIRDAALWSTRIQTPLTHVVSRDKWLELDIRSYQFVIGAWCLFNNNININPAPTSSETVKYYYISKNLFTDAGATELALATADGDTFRLDERLLKLCVIYKWKMQKGLPYGEDMANYENLLDRLIVQDGGTKMLQVGVSRHARGARIAYPQPITVV